MAYKHRKKGFVVGLEIKDATMYVKQMMRQVPEYRSGQFKVKTASDAESVLMFLNNPANTCSKSFSDILTGTPYWNHQLISYVPSNLGKGYIFYFICNGCLKRVKYLYQYHSTEPPTCRTCCSLDYIRKSHSTRPTVNLKYYQELGSKSPEVKFCLD